MNGYETSGYPSVDVLQKMALVDEGYKYFSTVHRGENHMTL